MCQLYDRRKWLRWKQVDVLSDIFLFEMVAITTLPKSALPCACLVLAFPVVVNCPVIACDPVLLFFLLFEAFVTSTDRIEYEQKRKRSAAKLDESNGWSNCTIHFDPLTWQPIQTGGKKTLTDGDEEKRGREPENWRNWLMDWFDL